MKILLILLLMTIQFVSHAQTCSQLEWTKEDSRTQGGVWVWFPGKFRASSLSHANVMAYGQALDYLVSECGQTHTEVKFHEKCVEEKNGQFMVYVRASITQAQCKESKYGSEKIKKLTFNHQLDRKLKQYRSFIAQSEVDLQSCNSRSLDECYLRAYDEWKNNNTLLASAYAKVACINGDFRTCGFLGYLHYEMGDLFKARRYLKIACDRKDEQSCKDLKGVEEDIRGDV